MAGYGAKCAPYPPYQYVPRFGNIHAATAQGLPLLVRRLAVKTTQVVQFLADFRFQPEFGGLV